mgnify:CR=1 FL=1
MRFWNAARVFFALWYLFGWTTHLWMVTQRPQDYALFGRTALFPWFRDLWLALVQPNIIAFASLLIVFELSVGILMLSRGRWVKLALVGSITFNLFLIQLGLTTVTSDPWVDFMWNRLPNILFAAAQVPLLFVDYQQSLPEVVRGGGGSIKSKGHLTSDQQGQLDGG